MMSIQARRELVVEVAVRYRSAGKVVKGRILDQLTATAGYDRKYALKLLSRPPDPSRKKRTRRRARKYGEAESTALKRLWPVSGYLGARRLTAALGPLIDALEPHGEWVPQEPVRSNLLTMSAAACGRLLKEIRPRERAKGLSTTRPGTLKKQIAIRRGTDWDDVRPGFFEADLVAHCGSECEGEFFYTLTMTDVSTGWTELAPLRSKGQAETLTKIKAIRSRLPFRLSGIDSDNGSEFINWHLARYCLEEGIVFTRGRPFAKNDGCRVEQKNWAVVRRHTGYSRLNTEEHFRYLSELHATLRLLVNFFEPSSKLLAKQKLEKTVKKTFDVPKTPYQRVLESELIDHELKDCLREKYLQLNPAALRRKLQLIKHDLLGHDLVSFLDEAINTLKCDS